MRGCEREVCEMGGCGGKCVRWEGVEGSARDGRVWREV